MELERANSEEVLRELEELIPYQDLSILETLCHLGDEMHWGVLVGNPEAAWVLHFRCQMKWWTKLIQRSTMPKLSGPLASYTLALNQGPDVWRPTSRWQT